MYKESRHFQTPVDETIIWRYMDFTKFVDLLLNSKLFFNRSDNFEDPFEGIFRLNDYENTKELWNYEELTKKFYFLNCWHMNNNQSDAMWKIFLDTKNGIAVKSSICNLKKSLQGNSDEIFIGEVQYREYENKTFLELMFEQQNKTGSQGRSLNQFSYKRISFEHEKELRLFYIDMPIPHAVKDGIPREPLSYKKIDINLEYLITEIVVAPFADIWLKDLVNQIVGKCGFNFKITKSELYNLNY
jgi:hypothetical protein